MKREHFSWDSNFLQLEEMLKQRELKMGQIGRNFLVKCCHWSLTAAAVEAVNHAGRMWSCRPTLAQKFCIIFVVFLVNS